MTVGNRIVVFRGDCWPDAPNIGTAEAVSLLPRPKRCGESWWIMLIENVASSMVATTWMLNHVENNDSMISPFTKLAESTRQFRTRINLKKAKNMNWKFTFAFLITVAFCSVSFGQTKNNDGNGDLGIFQSDEDRDQFWTVLKQTENPEIEAMLPMIYDITRGKPIGTSGPWGVARHETPMMQVLADPSVRQELEMVDDQYKELQDRSSQLQKQLAEQLRAVDLSDTKGLASQIIAIRSRTREELESVLLPHQLTRLRQISAQSQLRHRSLVDVITSDPLKSDLEISDSQADQLKEAEREIGANLAKQITELRTRARKKLLSKLRSSQREQVDEIFGDFFETDQRKQRKVSKDEK